MVSKRKRVVPKLQWADPPEAPTRKGGRDHDVIAAELRAKPGVWADLGAYGTATSAYSTATGIRAGRRSMYRPAGDFEAQVHKFDDGPHIFVRYMGDGAK